MSQLDICEICVGLRGDCFCALPMTDTPTPAVSDEGLVERVARALLQIRIDRTGEDWQRYRMPDSWKLFEEDARTALAVK